jgi:hypothetical protein
VINKLYKLWNDINSAFMIASMYFMVNPKVVVIVSGVVVVMAVVVACC